MSPKKREPTAGNRIRRHAEREAAKRGLKGAKADEWVDAFFEASKIETESVRRQLAGEPPLPDEGWLYARSPASRPQWDPFRTGKWLVFCSHPYFEEVWGKLKTATEAGELGCATKIRNPENPIAKLERALVACVYTDDFQDTDDVRRVLMKLRDLGFERAPLQYKRDADTLRGNYGESVSTYISPPGSRDFQSVG